MTKEKTLEILKGLKGESFTVTSEWVKENDDEVFETLLDRLKEFEQDENNETYAEDVEAFERGEWLVSYTFTGKEVRYYAGKDGQNLANQTTWASDSYEDVTEYAPEVVEKYLEQIEK